MDLCGQGSVAIAVAPVPTLFSNPLGARIISIANALDAMLRDWPYRDALPMSHACEEIRRCAGTQFDPKIVEVFLTIPESHWIDLRESLGSPFRLTHLRKCGGCPAVDAERIAHVRYYRVLPTTRNRGVRIWDFQLKMSYLRRSLGALASKDCLQSPNFAYTIPGF